MLRLCQQARLNVYEFLYFIETRLQTVYANIRQLLWELHDLGRLFLLIAIDLSLTSGPGNNFLVLCTNIKVYLLIVGGAKHGYS